MKLYTAVRDYALGSTRAESSRNPRALRVAQLLAVGGGVLCLIVVGFFWSTRAVHGIVTPLLLALAVCGVAAALSAAVALRRGDRTTRWSLMWTGGVAACGIIGLMSFGPIVAAALTMLLPSLIVCRYRGSRGIIVSTAVFLLSFTVWFAALLWVVTRSGVAMVPVPANSAISRALPAFDYADAFRIELPLDSEGDVDLVAHAVRRCMKPLWLGDGVSSRNAGLRFEPGASLGDWAVYDRDHAEIILGLNRSHIDLRLSLLLEREERCWSVTATTVARYNNWMGRLYFIPVRFGHQIVLSDTMRRVEAQLSASESDGKGY